MYTPEPINTDNVEVPAELSALLEQLAENVHENWAKERIGQGWTYGEKRSDELKTSPCLVPYEELDEKERDYDRKTAMETIKLIIKLGYTIEKK